MEGFPSHRAALVCAQVLCLTQSVTQPLKMAALRQRFSALGLSAARDEEQMVSERQAK